MRGFVLFVVAFFTSLSCHGQQDTSVCSVTNCGISGFPLAFYLPETGFSAGGVGILTFRRRQDTTILLRPSSVQVGAAYTSRGQLLLFTPFEIYLQNGAYRLQGELGYYRFQYNYHGLGPNSLAANLETYDVTFPRVRATVLKAVTQEWLVGLGAMYDGFDITGTEPEGILRAEQPTGVGGGTVAGLMATLLFDSRDHLFDPRHGVYAEASIQQAISILGSTFDYSRWRLDLRTYRHLRGGSVLAGQFYTSYATSGTPFFQMPYLGSGRRARGIADRRFIARSVTNIQADIRFPIWKRFGGVAFGSMSVIADDLGSLSDSRIVPAAGVGIRYILSKTELTRIRLDYGISAEGGQFYLTLNEAF